MPDLIKLIAQSLSAQETFRAQWESFNDDDSVRLSIEKASTILQELQERLNDNYPFFHPRYVGQMLKPPHPFAMAAYVMAMQINPNNHALDGGPATAKMEMEVIEQFAAMFGCKEHLGHLTSSGTIANLEALWVARSIHPDKKIAFSSSAHYTHRRMCEVIGVESIEIPSSDNGKMNLNALEQELQKGNIGTVVATLGTTGLGAVDPLHEILSLCKKHGARVHADCAYGGFFTLLAHAPEPIIDPNPFLALKDADSIVVDPHKHGLQPYGCGSILFKDPSVGKYYKHDSPYTYFTSKDLHLGEISLECSRAGAAAAALWATLKYFPLHYSNGLGTILTQTREAALLWNEVINKSKKFIMFTEPELDIVTFFSVTEKFSSDSTSEASRRIFTEGMTKKEKPLYLATFVVDSQSIKNKFPEFSITSEKTTILRSVLMKPEQKNFVAQFVKELEELVEE